MIHVELIDSAGGDLSIVNSARVSFAKEVKEIGEGDERLITYLYEHKHDTPFRHNFISLRCSVPVFLARQLGKHQAGLSWNEESRRYIDHPPEFYCPDEWRSRPQGGIKQGSEGKHPLSDEWTNKYMEYIVQADGLYEGMLKNGIAPEMARMVLPQSMMVNFIWSGNLLSFAHVYNLRAGNGSQAEAQEFATKLSEAIAPEFPIAWEVITYGR